VLQASKCLIFSLPPIASNTSKGNLLADVLATEACLSCILPNKTPWWLVIPVGLVYAVIYYVVFRFLIVKFNFKTIQASKCLIFSLPPIASNTSKGNLLADVLATEACFTRLRVEVNDKSKVDVEGLKALGASGVLEVGNNMQVLYRPLHLTHQKVIYLQMY
jgi:glucose-like phosphotransferase system IIB component